jgi:hypothetical protein
LTEVAACAFHVRTTKSIQDTKPSKTVGKGILDAYVRSQVPGKLDYLCNLRGNRCENKAVPGYATELHDGIPSREPRLLCEGPANGHEPLLKLRRVELQSLSSSCLRGNHVVDGSTLSRKCLNVSRIQAILPLQNRASTLSQIHTVQVTL